MTVKKRHVWYFVLSPVLVCSAVPLIPVQVKMQARRPNGGGWPVWHEVELRVCLCCQSSGYQRHNTDEPYHNIKNISYSGNYHYVFIIIIIIMYIFSLC